MGRRIFTGQEPTSSCSWASSAATVQRGSSEESTAYKVAVDVSLCLFLQHYEPRSVLLHHHPLMLARFLNIAAYLFVPLDDLARRRRELKVGADAAKLRGTILLSREGINLFIAGEEQPLREFLKSLTDQPEFASLTVKESWSDQQPFNRMLVRLKSEIISLGVGGLDPQNRPAPKLAPQELKRWLDEGRDVVLLDVRNDYEVGVGTFRGARAFGLDHFRHFPAAVQTLPEAMKSQPVVMFCTGGIRCEKAGPYMQQHGFQSIFQLDGGILKYFEDCGGAHYDGDCFVFDQRVALDPQLQASGLALCFVCQAILSLADQASPLYVIDKSCPHCAGSAERTIPTVEFRDQQIQAAISPLPGSIPYDNIRPIRIPERLNGMTLKACLANLYPHLDDGYWTDEFRGGRVTLGDKVVSEEMVARSGQRYSHWFPNTIEPAVNTEIAILYEDESLLVADKPAPMPMHPRGRFNRNTLVWILRQALSMPGLRPVHRLDANTTGVAIFAKTKAVAAQMQRLFDGGNVIKTYLTQCYGVPSDERFVCSAPISQARTIAGGRMCASARTDENEHEYCNAETQFVRVQVLDDQTSLLEANPITGRTNQIRLHLWHLGHPIVGDPLYLPNGQLGGTQTLEVDVANREPLRLHAWRVKFQHPITGEAVLFESALPW